MWGPALRRPAYHQVPSDSATNLVLSGSKGLLDTTTWAPWVETQSAKVCAPAVAGCKLFPASPSQSEAPWFHFPCTFLCDHKIRAAPTKQPAVGGPGCHPGLSSSTGGAIGSGEIPPYGTAPTCTGQRGQLVAVPLTLPSGGAVLASVVQGLLWPHSAFYNSLSNVLSTNTVFVRGKQNIAILVTSLSINRNHYFLECN